MLSLNVVYFGAVRAQIVSASANRLVVKVPLGATYAPISVSSLYGYKAATQQPFTVIYDGTPGLAQSSLGQSAAWRRTFGFTRPRQTVAADLNGDGKPDLAVVRSDSPEVAIFVNADGGTGLNANSLQLVTPSPVMLEAGGGSYAAAAADIDGDSRLDLIVADYAHNRVSVFRNTTASPTSPITFAAKVEQSVGAHPMGLSIGDFDGNGKLDIAVANYSGQS